MLSKILLPSIVISIRYKHQRKGATMVCKHNPADIAPMLRSMDSLMRWCFMASIVAALSAIINYVSLPEPTPRLLIQTLLALGCVGLGIYLSLRISKLESNLDHSVKGYPRT